MFSLHTRALAQAVLDQARARGLRIATAESCTGGLVAGALTDIPGSSDVVEVGYVTYSNAAKTAALGVSAALITGYGAVSESVARAMAEGALAAAGVEMAVAITGVAGPGGGTADRPVGLVHFAVAKRGGPTLHLEARLGDLGRGQVREASVDKALELMLSAMA